MRDDAKSYEQIDSNNYVLDTNNPKHHDFYKTQNHCKACGHELEIKTKKKIGAVQLSEETYCPKCGHNSSKNYHGIQ